MVITSNQPDTCGRSPQRIEVTSLHIEACWAPSSKRLKHEGEIGWAPLFGRLPVRQLNQAFDPGGPSDTPN